jgi:hypothetical protein
LGKVEPNSNKSTFRKSGAKIQTNPLLEKVEQKFKQIHF